jgi:hypothetical protein
LDLYYCAAGCNINPFRSEKNNHLNISQIRDLPAKTNGPEVQNSKSACTGSMHRNDPTRLPTSLAYTNAPMLLMVTNGVNTGRGGLTNFKLVKMPLQAQ